jgi:hypothetical protein
VRCCQSRRTWNRNAARMRDRKRGWSGPSPSTLRARLAGGRAAPPNLGKSSTSGTPSPL